MKKITTSLLSIWAMFQVMTLNVYATGNFPTYMKPVITEKFQAFIAEYNILINGVWAFLVMSSILIFIVHFIKLGQWSQEPFVRKKIMQDLLITGVCTGLLGSFWLFYFLITRIFL